MRIMEYHIISGKVVETRRCYLPVRDSSIKVRGQRKAGNTSLSKIARNERGAVNHLARIMNTNFGGGFMLVTLKYDNGRVPKDYEELKKNSSVFLRKAREWCRKNGQEFSYICVNANWNPKRDCSARFHHHLILPIMSTDMLMQLWPAGEFHVRRVKDPSDLTTLARYLVANVHGLAAGEKKWTTSKGMDKPIYTEPKPVDDICGIEPIPETTVVEAAQYTDEEGYVISSYMRAISRGPIRVRGGMVILPRRGKKAKPPKTMDEALWMEDD